MSYVKARLLMSTFLMLRANFTRTSESTWFTREISIIKSAEIFPCCRTSSPEWPMRCRCLQGWASYMPIWNLITSSSTTIVSDKQSRAWRLLTLAQVSCWILRDTSLRANRSLLLRHLSICPQKYNHFWRSDLHRSAILDWKITLRFLMCSICGLWAVSLLKYSVGFHFG